MSLALGQVWIPQLHLKRVLGWEIRLELRWIPWLFQFWTFWTPEFSSEFYFLIIKMCSRQFWTHFLRFRILSCHWFFRFHESENIPAITIFWPAKKISSRISQPVDLTMLNCVDVGTVHGKANLPTIIEYLLKLSWFDFCGQNNHAAKITSTHFE